MCQSEAECVGVEHHEGEDLRDPRTSLKARCSGFIVSLAGNHWKPDMIDVHTSSYVITFSLAKHFRLRPATWTVILARPLLASCAVSGRRSDGWQAAVVSSGPAREGFKPAPPSQERACFARRRECGAPVKPPALLLVCDSRVTSILDREKAPKRYILLRALCLLCSYKGYYSKWLPDLMFYLCYLSIFEYHSYLEEWRAQLAI